MKNRSHTLGVTNAFLLLSLLAFISACDTDTENFDRVVPVTGNYFPTSKGSQWTYERKALCGESNQSSVCLTTHHSIAEGEVLLSDASYEPYSSATASFQFVKAVDHEYFGYGYYLPQYKFLDVALPVNRIWEYGGGQPTKEQFRIMEVNASKVVRGVEYQNVIVVKNTLYAQVRCKPENYEPVANTIRFYAKDVGEIYMIHTYDYRGNAKTYENALVDYVIAQ